MGFHSRLCSRHRPFVVAADRAVASCFGRELPARGRPTARREHAQAAPNTLRSWQHEHPAAGLCLAMLGAT